jgi:hypothetical protein
MKQNKKEGTVAPPLVLCLFLIVHCFHPLCVVFLKIEVGDVDENESKRERHLIITISFFASLLRVEQLPFLFFTNNNYCPLLHSLFIVFLTPIFIYNILLNKYFLILVYLLTYYLFLFKLSINKYLL